MAARPARALTQDTHARDFPGERVRHMQHYAGLETGYAISCAAEMIDLDLELCLT
jgi:hypothetical protein